MVNLVELSQAVALLDRIATPAVVDRALNAAGIGRSVLRAEPGFLPYVIEAAVLESVARSIGEPHLGAQLGKAFDYSAYSNYANYVLSAPDLGSAIIRGRRAMPLVHPGSYIDLRKSKCHVVVGRCSDIRSVVGHRHLDEGSFFVIGNVMRHFLGPEWRADWIEITSQEPEHASAMEELTGTPVRTGAPFPALAIRTDDLKAPNPNRPNPELTVTLSELPLLMGVRPPKTTEDFVRQMLRIQLVNGDLSIESVARCLSLGPRSLQRKLNSEGTSFREIREQFLQERACALLSDSDFAIDDIAQSLGYDEPNSFRRAFRAWTGTTPSHYRAAARRI